MVQVTVWASIISGEFLVLEMFKEKPKKENVAHGIYISVRGLGPISYFPNLADLENLSKTLIKIEILYISESPGSESLVLPEF